MSESMDRLTGVMARLLGEGGCPWDREQTHESLKPFLLEETYEVLEAIDSGKPDAMREELGDVLFQVLFHAEMAKASRLFDLDAIADATADKMIRRHPHIFDAAPGEAPPDSKAVLVKWEALKRAEAGHQTRKSAIDGVPKSLPALLRAHQLQARAARTGFDWKTVGPVFDKVREEVAECEAVAADEVANGKVAVAGRMEEEIGDLLFSIVNVARHLSVNSEEALRKAANRFAGRFQKIEADAETEGGLATLSPERVDQLWEAAKSQERLLTVAKAGELHGLASQTGMSVSPRGR